MHTYFRLNAHLVHIPETLLIAHLSIHNRMDKKKSLFSFFYFFSQRRWMFIIIIIWKTFLLIAWQFFCIVNCDMLFFDTKINEQNVIPTTEWYILVNGKPTAAARRESLLIFSKMNFDWKWNNEKCETKRNDRGAL